MAKTLLTRSARSIALVLFLILVTSDEAAQASGLRPGAVAVLPEDGRELYFRAIAAAEHEIRIEICVLEDPQILEQLRRLSIAASGSRDCRSHQVRRSSGGASESRAVPDGFRRRVALEQPGFHGAFPRSSSSTPTWSSTAPRALTRRRSCSTGTSLTPRRQYGLRELQSACSRTTGRTPRPSAGPRPCSTRRLGSPRRGLVVSPVNSAERLVASTRTRGGAR